MDNEVFLRIDRLMKQQRKTTSELNKFLGVKQSTYDNWRRGKSESYFRHIGKISEFLNVSPNYLISGTENVHIQKSRRQEYEDRILNIIRSIPENEAERLVKLAETFAATITLE